MKKNSQNYDFLLEIFTEEIPARLVNEIGLQLEKSFVDEMAKNSINYSKIKTYYTPRRIVVLINGLKSKQKDFEQFILGPPKKISMDKNNKLLKPGLSFVKKNQIKSNQIKITEKEGSEFLSVNKKVKGLNTKDFLRTAAIQSIKSIKNKKFMRWGESEFHFIRPIKNIFALFGRSQIKINIESIDNNNIIFGHRFYSEKGKKISSIAQYFNYMKKSSVILDFEERKEIIINQITKIEKKNKFFVEKDEDLLNHVANLTEYPNVLLGEFDKSFLKIPSEVNISVMKNHQKYFPVFKNKALTRLDSNFIFVSGSPFLNKKVVISGNEKVIRARLNDAKFFYEEDKKIGLEKLSEKLQSITFIDGIGTYKDKSKRIFDISQNLSNKLKIKDDDIEGNLEDSCRLIKADLSSQMVYEFPELQGIMGKYYYQNSNKTVSKIIEGHYLPRGRSDMLPKETLSQIISIADKIDTISSCFYLGMKPTGSSDAYGLRRNSIGIIRIAENLNRNIDLIEILNFSIAKVEDSGENKISEENRERLLVFFNERIKNYFVENGFNVNIINSLVNNGLENKDVKSINDKAIVLKRYLDDSKLDFIVETFKRLKNITKDNSETSIKKSLLKNNFEISLYENLKGLEESLSFESINRNPETSLKKILDTTMPLTRFFENVLVMDEDVQLRQNRLNLLTRIKNKISGFANFSEI
ncbi:MAG: glycine--tRNA ligase subunit beta [Thermodesulfobacteriota bacterium]|nr:glycine--tRNA ligase subunit beta [Thermodesulfobacteriota bacterium]